MTTTPERFQDRPSKLSLTHVRMPPGCAPSARPERPFMVHAAYYRQGNTRKTSPYACGIFQLQLDGVNVLQRPKGLELHETRSYIQLVVYFLTARVLY